MAQPTPLVRETLEGKRKVSRRLVTLLGETTMGICITVVKENWMKGNSNITQTITLSDKDHNITKTTTTVHNI